MSEGLQNKMYNYEVTPPAGVWEKITAALDESESQYEFPSKLYGIEIIPPATAWDKIKNSLAAKEVEIPQQKKAFPIFRYAIAAAITGLIAWGGIQLLKAKSADKEIAQQEKKLQGNDTSIPKADENNLITNDKNDDVALEGSKQSLAKLDIPVRKKIKPVSKNYFIQHALSGTGTNDPDYTTYQENNTAGRYIAVMTPDCNVVRISKKLDHLVCCVSGDDPGTICKDQLQRWREQIAASSIASSPGNFMDIVSLVNSLQTDND